MRFYQCLILFGLAYAFFRQLAIKPRTSVIGVALIAGILSLSLGPLGASTFSLDRFTDAIFYLGAAILVLRGHELWVVPLMILAIANR